MRNAVCFFSGTGNSFDVAKRLGEKLGDTTLVNIADAGNARDFGGFETVGFVFPVYGFTMPNIVRRFVADFKFADGAACLGTGTYYYCVYTLGAFALGAGYRVKTAVETAGGNLSYTAAVYMPENYILFSVVPSDKMIKKQLDNSVRRVEEIAADIAARAVKTPRKSLLNALFDKTAERELPKLNVTAKGFTVSGDCVLCGLCVKLCPVGNIEEAGGKITFGERCESCLLCMHACPKRAINSKHVTPGKKRYLNPNVDVGEMKNY